MESIRNISLLQLTEKLTAANDFESRVHIAAAHLMSTGLFPNVEDLEKAASSFYKRLLISEKFSLSRNLQCPVQLLKAQDSKLQAADSDYGLSKASSGLYTLIAFNDSEITCILVREGGGVLSFLWMTKILLVGRNILSCVASLVHCSFHINT